MTMRKNVLVITEDMVLREKIKKEFQGNTIEIYHAISSETALKMYMMRTYCLVIMDIFIRESDGLELLKTIRHLKPVPILVLASKEDNKEKLRALKAGAACYFSPPYCWEECLVYANSLMDLYVDLQEKEVEGPLTFGTDLVIDLLGHQALLRGVNLKLTRLEFDLLYCLASHTGQVLSREQLYDLVWKGNNSYQVDEVVKAHIKALRRKLENSNIEYIKNVWGIGYQFLSELEEP